MQNKILVFLFLLSSFVWSQDSIYSSEISSVPAPVNTTTSIVVNTSSPGPSIAAAPLEMPNPLNSGDIAWMLMSVALVFLMTFPGLALFYGGLVRKKNILSVLMQCISLMFVLSLLWVLFGYSLAFGPDIHGIIGDPSWFGLSHVSSFMPHRDATTGISYAATIPHSLFMMFQMMFAVITPALIIGAFAERMRFIPFLVFSILWSFIIYYPVAHWIWGIGGFLGAVNPAGRGAVDFAGGIVVHVTAGFSALATALFLGKRKGYPAKMSPPHNLPLAAIGAGLLWFGWFGFNAGSALSAGPLSVSAIIATHVAGAMAGLTWAALDWIFNRKPTVLGAITGAVGGLATVTPASGFVDLWGALAIGFFAGFIPFLVVMVIKPRLHVDDSLDAFGVHGVGGFIGSIAVGIFANPVINGKTGLLYGESALFVSQIKAVVFVAAYSLLVTFILLKIVNKVMPLRASEHEESVGLDLTQHKESAYTIID
jgi:Amt family ammonium transporter